MKPGRRKRAERVAASMGIKSGFRPAIADPSFPPTTPTETTPLIEPEEIRQLEQPATQSPPPPVAKTRARPQLKPLAPVAAGPPVKPNLPANREPSVRPNLPPGRATVQDVDMAGAPKPVRSIDLISGPQAGPPVDMEGPIKPIQAGPANLMGRMELPQAPLKPVAEDAGPVFHLTNANLGGPKIVANANFPLTKQSPQQ